MALSPREFYVGVVGIAQFHWCVLYGKRKSNGSHFILQKFVVLFWFVMCFEIIIYHF